LDLPDLAAGDSTIYPQGHPLQGPTGYLRNVILMGFARGTVRERQCRSDLGVSHQSGDRTEPQSEQQTQGKGGENSNVRALLQNNTTKMLFQSCHMGELEPLSAGCVGSRTPSNELETDFTVQ